MQMEIVPVHAKIEVENVPPDALACMSHDRRCVTDERAAVEAIGRQIRTATLHDAVLARPVVRPPAPPADVYRDVRRGKKEVADGDIHGRGSAGLDGDRTAHQGPVNAAYVV